MKSNSWVVTDKTTGRAVLETFSANVAKAINRTKYSVETSYDYLCRFNESIKATPEHS